MRLLTIMRGLPGAGKSTEAGKILGNSQFARVLSTDDYFVDDDGNYDFDSEVLAQAHAWNQGRAAALMLEKVPHIIIDNTNCAYWEMGEYVKLAVRHVYEVEISQPNNAMHRSTIAAIAQLREYVKSLVSRSSHNLDFGTIMGMAARYDTDEEAMAMLANGDYEKFIGKFRPPWEE